MFDPKFIEIKGVQFVNKGAELMLYAIIEQIETRWPGAQIVLAPNPYSPYQERIKVNAFQKLSLRKNRFDFNSLAYRLPASVKRHFRHSLGIITEADIDLVLDASGFAYGDQWGALKIKHLAGELKRYQQHSIPYVFLPQALGPFTRPNDVRYLKDALPRATFIAARESTSFEHVKAIIGEAPNLYQFPDFTNLVSGILPNYYTQGDSKVLFIPNSNMVGERNTHKPEWKSTYVDVFANAIKIVKQKGLTPVLLNHEGKGDGELCEQIRERSGLAVDIIEEPHPLKVKGIIGASKAVVCSRFHGCVSALSQAVPCLGTSWSHKYERLFEDYECANLLLEPSINGEDLEQQIDDAISEKMRNTISSNAKKLKQVSSELWSAVVSALN